MSFAGPREPDPFDGAVRRAPEGRPPGESRPPAAHAVRRRTSGSAHAARSATASRTPSSACSLAASLVCVGLIAARSWYSHTYHYWFLLWNLALAWVPFVFAAIAYRLASARRAVLYVLIVAAAIVWLAFFPNAPYILTDFLHLGSMGDIVPGWYDVLMLYWFAWTGLMLGDRLAVPDAGDRRAGPGHGGRLGLRRGRRRPRQLRHLPRPVPALEQLGPACAGRARSPTSCSAASPTRPRSRGCSASRCCSRCCSSSSTWRCTSSPSSPSRPAGRERSLTAAGLARRLPPPLRGAYTPAMTPGNIPRLIETLKAHAGDDKHIACEDAFQDRSRPRRPARGRRPHLQRAGHQGDAVPARLLLSDRR